MRAKRVFVGDFRPPLLGELRVLWRSFGGKRLYVLYRAVGGRKTGLAQRRVVLRHLLAPNPTILHGEFTIAVSRSQLAGSINRELLTVQLDLFFGTVILDPVPRDDIEEFMRDMFFITGFPVLLWHTHE